MDEDRQITKEEAWKIHQDVLAHGYLPIWTITYNTADHGDKYIARPHIIMKGQSGPANAYLIADTLEEIRELLPPGLTYMVRDANDDPVIVETWV